MRSAVSRNEAVKDASRNFIRLDLASSQGAGVYALTAKFVHARFHDLVEQTGMRKSKPSFLFACVRNTPFHVLETFAIRLDVGDVHNRAGGHGLVFNLRRQIVDAD